MGNPILEIDTVVNRKIKEMIDSGAVSKLIESKVENTINEAIDDELRSYSDFGKQLKEYINKSLQIDFDKLGFEGYHENLLRVMSKVYKNSMESVHLEKVKKLTEKMLANPPKVVKFSEIVNGVKEKAKQYAKENEENHYHESFTFEDNITCIISGRNDHFFTYISLDPKSGVSEYSCAYRIGISKSRDTTEIFSLSMNGKDGNDLFVQQTYGLERLLFKAKCASSAFEFDIEHPDTSYEVEIEPSCHC